MSTSQVYIAGSNDAIVAKNEHQLIFANDVLGEKTWEEDYSYL
jgi:hypothetical protein